MYEVVAEMKNPTCQQGSGNGTITALNDHNVVVGNFAINCGFDQQPFMWTAETGVVVIPLPPDTLEARAMDVNNNNEIVGSLVRSDLQTVAFHWKDGVWTELPSIPGFPWVQARAISDAGQIVGDAFNPLDGSQRALRWKRGRVSEIDLPIGPFSRANDINNSSQVTGWMASRSPTPVAFLLVGDHVENIGAIPNGMTGLGVALNKSGVLVGEGHVALGRRNIVVRSFIATSPDDKVDLGVLAQGLATRVFALNDLNQVVGTCDAGTNSSNVPFVWQHGEILDLESLIVDAPPDKNLSVARAINNAGWIAIDGIILSPADRPLGDANIDCVVDERDLIAVLDDWGPEGGKENHPTDMVTSATFQPPGDGIVDGADLAVVLGNWSSE